MIRLYLPWILQIWNKLLINAWLIYCNKRAGTGASVRNQYGHGAVKHIFVIYRRGSLKHIFVILRGGTVKHIFQAYLWYLEEGQSSIYLWYLEEGHSSISLIYRRGSLKHISVIFRGGTKQLVQLFEYIWHVISDNSGTTNLWALSMGKSDDFDSYGTKHVFFI